LLICRLALVLVCIITDIAYVPTYYRITVLTLTRGQYMLT